MSTIGKFIIGQLYSIDQFVVCLSIVAAEMDLSSSVQERIVQCTPSLRFTHEANCVDEEIPDNGSIHDA